MNMLPASMTGCRALLLAALLGLPLAAPGDDGWRELHEEVRQGRLVSLPSVLDWLQAHYVGQVLEVELERDDDATRYDVEMIGPQGQLVEFEFDAASGKLLDVDGVNVEAMKRP
ncbi:peptidase [Halomonas sp. HP20-15]|uniref:PepSY domain-containing protein n=1 Tax=Halomonas sp. HP20-15 TaxID=3085901 RepID=UPI002981596B|nr:PepSY domain-containing protein [Halomonas sp. HP20-15]MDW5378917.1 peptidase [Halomonas sp. HP20-15]